MAEELGLSAEILADATKERQITNLELVLDIALTRGRAANLEAGKTLNKLKPLFVFGTWDAFMQKKSKAFGVTVRTLRNYMQLATEEEKPTAGKTETFSFLPATDQQATDIKSANEQAKQEFATEPKPKKTRKPKRETIRLAGIGIYPLPLPLPGDKCDALDELQQSQNWDGAVKFFLATVDRVLQHYGYTPEPQPFDATDNDLPGIITAQRAEKHENHPTI